MAHDTKARTEHRTGNGATREAELFYCGAVKNSAELLEAMRVEGLDQELALLRTRLKEMTDGESPKLDDLLQAAEMIGRTVMRRHRISPKRADEMAENIAAAMHSLAEQLFPERVEV